MFLVIFPGGIWPKRVGKLLQVVPASNMHGMQLTHSVFMTFQYVRECVPHGGIYLALVQLFKQFLHEY